MHCRQLQAFPVLIALILYLAIYPLPARSSTSQESNSNQDQNQAVDTGKPAPGDQAKVPVSNIKSAPTDEGQLATVNNAIHEEASTHGKKSSAEACAKHLKEAIENQ